MNSQPQHGMNLRRRLATAVILNDIASNRWIDFFSGQVSVSASTSRGWVNWRVFRCLGEVWKGFDFLANRNIAHEPNASLALCFRVCWRCNIAFKSIDRL